MSGRVWRFVTDRSQIPGVPDEVPSASTLAEVAAFVLEQLSGAEAWSLKPGADGGAYRGARNGR